MSKVEQAANHAVWDMQFDTNRAVRFLVRTLGVTDEDARKAIQKAVLWYRA